MNMGIYCCCVSNPSVLWLGTGANTSIGGVIAKDASMATLWEFKTGGTVARPVVGNSFGRMCRSENYLYVPFQRNSSWQGTDGSNKSVAVLDLQAGTSLLMLDTGSTANTTAVTSSGQFAVASTRNNAWPGSGGAQASVFFYDTDGTLLWTYDTGTTALTCTIDNGGNVVVGGLFNSTTNVHLWRLQASDGTLLASMRLDTNNGSVSSIDSGPNAVCCCVRSIAAPNNDIFEIPSNLSGVNNAAQKFNGNAAPTAALSTTPFSWISGNSASTAVQLEAGTEINNIACGLAAINNVCRTDVSTAPECWVASNIVTALSNNYAKITGATMDVVTPYQLKYSGSTVNPTTIVQVRNWHG